MRGGEARPYIGTGKISLGETPAIRRCLSPLEIPGVGRG